MILYVENVRKEEKDRLMFVYKYFGVFYRTHLRVDRFYFSRK